jgi:hypothetical protein
MEHLVTVTSLVRPECLWIGEILGNEAGEASRRRVIKNFLYFDEWFGMSSTGNEGPLEN